MSNLTYRGGTKPMATQNENDLYLDGFSAFLDWLLELSRQDTRGNYDSSNSGPLFVFVSKKGYWLYRMVIQYLREESNPSSWIQAINNNSIEVKSDRYFTKIISLDEIRESLTDRRIYVVDDFLVRGHNISRFCKLIKKIEPTVKPIPVVYAKWTGFKPSEEDTKEFSELKYKSEISLYDIGKLSVWETRKFHRSGIPYVIDLPFLKAVGASEEAKPFFSIELTKEQFKQLTNASDSVWQYIDTSCWIGDYHVTSGYFYCCHDLFADKFRQLIQNLVVECLYDSSQDSEKISLTFTPFAILRSIKQDELICRFRIAFSGTAYMKTLANYLEDPKTTSGEENLNTALYRAVVFFFSQYIAINFKNYLYNQFGVVIDSDTEKLRDHWSPEFIDSLLYVFGNGLSNRLNKLYDKDDIAPYAPNSGGLVKRSDSMYYNMFAYFAFKRISGKKHEDFCAIEELESAMAGYSGYTVDNPVFKEMFTSTVLQLLNQGVISNHILFDSDTGIVQRGFRSGENSTLLVPFNQKAVFKAVYTYYQRMREADRYVQDFYYKNYDVFKNRLIRFIEEAELDSYFDLSEATDILCYFGEIEADALAQQIENKRYVIDELEQSISTDAKVAKMLEQYVLRMNFD